MEEKWEQKVILIQYIQINSFSIKMFYLRKEPQVQRIGDLEGGKSVLGEDSRYSLFKESTSMLSKS